MTPSMVTNQKTLDLMTSDLLPCCPDCGDLAHPAATLCDGCGAHLFPPAARVRRAVSPKCGCDACEETL